MVDVIFLIMMQARTVFYLFSCKLDTMKEILAIQTHCTFFSRICYASSGRANDWANGLVI